MFSCSHRIDYLDVVRYLLASGKVPAQSQDKHGRTLIFTAVMHNRPELLEFLLKKVCSDSDKLITGTGHYYRFVSVAYKKGLLP